MLERYITDEGYGTRRNFTGAYPCPGVKAEAIGGEAGRGGTKEGGGKGHQV
jgi:hypothetical protein